MQFTFKKVLLAFCFLHTLKPEALIWAQDAIKSSVEQTTQVNSLEEEVMTVKPNSAENPTSSETLEEQTTTTLPTVGCDDALNNNSDEECKCTCSKNPQSSTASAEITTTDASEEQTTTTTSYDDANNSAETTVTPNKDTSTSAADISDKSILSFNCTAAGNFAHPNDCRRYYSCNQAVGATDFEFLENICPAGLAFNTEFSSCMRDLSPCSREHGGFECLEAGSFADPESSTASYFRCVPRLGEQASSFHVFHIKCGAVKIFMPQLGKCFFDLNAPQLPFNSIEYTGMPDDEQLVKAELKQWKLKEKTKLKAEKLKLKYEKKLQKELAKKASKEAKEKAKKEEKAKKGKSISYDDDD